MIWSFCMSVANSTEVEFLIHNSEGQTYEDENGELRGIKKGGRRAFNLELVREMMILLDHPRKFRAVPFKRGIVYVQNEDNYAFFNVTRTPNREKSMKWVGPIQTDTSYFYELKSAPTGIQTLEDAKNLSQICVLNGGVHEAFLLRNGFNNLISNVSYSACFQMLALKRVSLTMSSVLSLTDRLNAVDISPQDIQQTPVSLFTTDGYITFSSNISDDVIQKWQKALDHLKESGKYSQIFDEYL